MNQFNIPSDFKDNTVCILGLGFVGLTLATVMADVGFNVIGVEIRDEVLKKLNSGKPHFFEPGLSEKLQQVLSSGRLKAYKKIPQNCPSTIYIITVGTPLDKNGIVNLNSIVNISEEIAAQLKDGDIIVLRSTVKLGTTRDVVRPILLKTSKKFNIAFCPERTIEGQAMTELRYLPQIIGPDCLLTGIRLSQVFQFLTPTIVRVSDMETAELIKLVDNTKRDVMFGFSNEVASICNIMGLDAKEVITSGRLGYSRTNLPLPGPVGGPCLSKDSYILAQSVEKFGFIPSVTMAARAVNERQVSEVSDFLKNLVSNINDFPAKPKIVFMGLAFKGRPATDDIRGSMAKPILMSLKKVFHDAEFIGFDPVVDSDSIKELGLIPEIDLFKAVCDANIVLILNNHQFFETMNIEKIADSLAEQGIIYDMWNTFSVGNFNLRKGIQYITFGNHKKPHVN